MRSLLAMVCAITLLSTAYLTLSFVSFHPLRVSYRGWLASAVLFVLQSVLTLLVLYTGGQRGFRTLALFGGAGILTVGLSSVQSAITNAHFEGYALLLGLGLSLQGILTILVIGPGIYRSFRPRH